MNDNEAANGGFRLRIRWQRWAAYGVSVLAVALLTLGLYALFPVFPLGDHPMPYLAVIMVVAYLFGEGPVAVTFVLALLAFDYYFGEPPETLLPHAQTIDGWSHLVGFVASSFIVGFAALLMRRSRHRIQRLADQLDESKRLAEHRRAELETILSSMIGGVVVIDTDRRAVYANPGAARMVRTRREIGQPVEVWIRAANIRELDGTPINVDDHPLLRALKGETVPEKLVLIDGESGPDTVVSASTAPIREPGGGITGAVLIARNITPQRRLQEELERQRTLLETFTQNVPVGLTFVDRDVHYVIANRALAEINRVPLERMIGRHPREFLPAALAADTETAVQKVFATGEPVQWRDFATVLDGERYFDVEYLPVRTSEGEIIGVGVVVIETTEQLKTRRELERSYEREHRIAETLQTSLLGAVPTRINSFEFETVYRAALEEARVGGDFYDVFQISEDKIGIVVGDVSGKGLSAAVQVAMAKYSLRGRAYDCDKPSIIMEQVNKALVRDMDIEGFVTIFAGVLDCTGKTLTYANGGHSPAIFWKAADRQPVLLGPTGPLVGIASGVTYQERTIELQRGDELLLGTDGLFEVQCGPGFLEIEGLLEIYAELKRSGVDSASELVARIVEFCRGELRDDIAVLRVSVVE